MLRFCGVQIPIRSWDCLSLQCRRILAGRVDIYFHRMFRPPSWNRKTVESWGEVKSLPRAGERKKNWGRRRGRKIPYFSFPTPHPLWHSVILAPILPVCSESKIVAKHSIDHQTRLHCRLGLSWVALLFQLLGYACIYIVTLLSIKWPRIKFPLKKIMELTLWLIALSLRECLVKSLWWRANPWNLRNVYTYIIRLVCLLRFLIWWVYKF